MSQAERTLRYREAQKARGYCQLSYWVPNTEKARMTMSTLADRLRQDFDKEKEESGA